jgi:hypothetical protein
MGKQTRVVQDASSRCRRGVGSRTQSQRYRLANMLSPTQGGLYREAATASVTPSKAARLLAKLSTTIRLGSSFAGAWGGRCRQGDVALQDLAREHDTNYNAVDTVGAPHDIGIL